MSLDDQLLAQQQESKGIGETTGVSDRAGGLREAQRVGRPDGQGATSLREAVLAEKRKEAAKAGKDEGGAGASASPMRQGASKLLQQSWINLIPSWGCTLIWINIHAFFLNLVFGDKLFCKLGDEWQDMIPGGGAAAAGAAGGVAGKVAGAAAEAKPPVKPSLEIWGLIGCDLGCLFIILAVASLIALVAKLFTDLPGTILTFFQSIWESLFGK